MAAISRAMNLSQLASFYGKAGEDCGGRDQDEEPGGFEWLCDRAGNTVSHHALLLINPHTSFFFRSELQMASEEGLDAYGAATWGQFFIYQGFNERAGWMHTSSGVDAVDEYLETVVNRDGRFYYKYGNEERPWFRRGLRLRIATATAGLRRSSRFTEHIMVP